MTLTSPRCLSPYFISIPSFFILPPVRARKQNHSKPWSPCRPNIYFTGISTTCPSPRKLTNMTILIIASQANNRQTASFRRLRPTRSQSPFFAETKDRTHIVIPTQASSTIEVRAARHLVNLANQSPNPYFAGLLIGRPGRLKSNDLANQSSGQQHPCQPANGVGCSNFKIGPISALNPSTIPKANFEI